jgi:hypothetical protein
MSDFIMPDGSPSAEFTECIRILGERFGVTHVRHYPNGGTITVDVPPPPGGELKLTIALTSLQAKYLAVSPISDEDLRANRLPDDWPRSPRAAYGA